MTTIYKIVRAVLVTISLVYTAALAMFVWAMNNQE